MYLSTAEQNPSVGENISIRTAAEKSPALSVSSRCMAQKRKAAWQNGYRSRGEQTKASCHRHQTSPLSHWDNRKYRKFSSLRIPFRFCGKKFEFVLISRLEISYSVARSLMPCNAPQPCEILRRGRGNIYGFGNGKLLSVF